MIHSAAIIAGITSTLGAHRKTDPGASQEPETPRASDGNTRTVSPVVSIENAFLDKELSIKSLSMEANCLALMLI